MGNHGSHQMDAFKKSQEYISEIQKIKVFFLNGLFVSQWNKVCT